MTLETLRTLHAEMLAAHKAYTSAEPCEVHHDFAKYKAAKFRYNVACGEYVAQLLEVEL